MPDTEWIDNMRKIMKAATEADGPCDITQGTVVGVSPLRVELNQKTTLSGLQLLLSRNVTDHMVTMSIPDIGMVEVQIQNELKVGERVLLIQKRSGQQYAVIDRC